MESTTWECKQQSDKLLEWIHGRMLSAKHVTTVTRTSPESLEVTSAALPAWAVPVAILFFPIGLLALLAKRTAVLRFRTEEQPGGAGTLLHVDGAVTPGVQKRLVEIYHELFPPGTT